MHLDVWRNVTDVTENIHENHIFSKIRSWNLTWISKITMFQKKCLSKSPFLASILDFQGVSVFSVQDAASHLPDMIRPGAPQVIKGEEMILMEKNPVPFGCFLKWWYPWNTPKWSILVGKPMVVGYHHFRKPPFRVEMIPFYSRLFRSQVVQDVFYQQYGWEFPGIFTRTSLSTCLWKVAKTPNRKKHRLSSPKLKTWLPSALCITNRLMRWNIDHYTTQSLEKNILIRKTENETKNGIIDIKLWGGTTGHYVFWRFFFKKMPGKNAHLPPVARFPHLGSW